MAGDDVHVTLGELLGAMEEAEARGWLQKIEKTKKPGGREDLVGDKVLSRGGSGTTGFWRLFDRIAAGKAISPPQSQAVKRGRKRSANEASTYQGVYKASKRTKRPYYVQWESIFVGQYKTEEHAARAFDAIQHAVYGETPNFPGEAPWAFAGK